MSNLPWRYFGCGREAGHYLFDLRKSISYPDRHSLDGTLQRFDGRLAPFPEPKMNDYKASFSRLGGLGYSALSWWDKTVDKRDGSNSILFAPSLVITPQEMLDEAPRWFPWVFSRLPTPLTLLHNVE